MNEPLCIAAKQAQRDPQIESIPGYCQRAARQVVTCVYKSRFAKWMKGADAKEAAANWLKSPYAIDPRRGSVPGDLLYWTTGHGPHGHVGIRLPGNLVWSNTTLSPHPDNGKCALPLDTFGAPDLIVRLPPP